MKVCHFIFLSIVLLALSCCGNKHQSQEEVREDEATKVTIDSVNLLGQWYIENIFFSDSAYVRPSEEVPGSRMYVLFEADCCYSVMTNCNHGAGHYKRSGNTITFDDAVSTELACDNMKTEEAMRKILPLLRTVEVENDSVMRINSVTESYLILLKAKETK